MSVTEIVMMMKVDEDEEEELEFHISDDNNDSKVIITSKLKCTFEFVKPCPPIF